MNKIKIVAGIFLILTSFTFTSCENEPIDGAINLDDFDNPNGGTMAFKADFGGATWSGTEAMAVVTSNFISVGATKADGSTFSILVSATGPGTYPANTNIIAYTAAGSEFGYWSINMANESENTGSITITNINTTAHTVSGTFNFKGYWSDTTNTSIIPVEFTNGVFTNIPYIPQQQTGDTFYAKLNGTEFVDTLLIGAEVTAGADVWINVAATDAALNDMTIAFNKTIAPGTYPIINSTTDNIECFYSPVDGPNDFDGISGSLTIISITADRVKGTFNFVGSDGVTNKTITEGSFDVGY